jgi:ABC-type proline/glycine betaine transport system ATPase subunit
MSLETSLELNNQLLTQHNALLERLITALASGVALRPDTVAQVQEYRETVPETKAENTVIRKVTLDDLSSATLSPWLHSTRTPQELSETMVQRVVDYRDAEGDKRVVQIDALDSALQGVKRANHLNKEATGSVAQHPELLGRFTNHRSTP